MTALKTAGINSRTGSFVRNNIDLSNTLALADLGTDMGDIMGFYNGTLLDPLSVTVASDGATITLSVEKEGTGDIRLKFKSGVVTIDCTPTDDIGLTEGTDASPQMNYLYYLESTGVLTKSTSGFPTAVEYCPVAKVLCQSAASLQTEDPVSLYVWKNQMADANDQGLLAHLAYWVRSQQATWESGVALTPTITTNGGAEDNVDIDTTAGVVLQLLPQTYPIFDTSSGSDVYVVNHNTAAYTVITDLNLANEDDAGNTIADSEWTNIVIWGVVSETTGACKLMANLPSGFHATAAAATQDVEKYSNYVIPDAYRGTGFLIARLTLKYTDASSGTWALEENLDLRNSGATGGTSVASTSFADNAFKITNVGDPTKIVDWDLSGVTTGTTRTITMPDEDITLPDTNNGLDQFAATTSAELLGVMSDETGTGALCFATSPTLVTPTLGVATATSINKVALTAPATAATLTISDGKTLTCTDDATIGAATVEDGTHSEIKLSTTTGIDGKIATTTSLYTVPGGKTCIVTKAVLRITTATALSVVGAAGIGVAAGEDDIFASVTLTGFNATTKLWTFTPSGLQVKASAAEVIKLGIDTGFTGTTITLAVELFGYLV